MSRVISENVARSDSFSRQLAASDPHRDIEQIQEQQLAKLEELAAAASTQQENLKQLVRAGFAGSRHFTERNGRVARVDRHVAGEITYQTSVEGPRSLLDSIERTENVQALETLVREYEAAKADPIYGAKRFACGRLWYTLTEPWTTAQLANVRLALNLPDSASCEQVERHFHFRFQQIYQKAPDDWTEAESKDWDTLASYIDFEAYERDNPPTDNRLGKLIDVDAEKVVIRWNTKGEVPYDAKAVPPQLLTASKNAFIRAEFYLGNGAEQWLYAHVEPPLPSVEAVFDEDMANARALPPANLPAADWPKVED